MRGGCAQAARRTPATFMEKSKMLKRSFGLAVIAVLPAVGALGTAPAAAQGLSALNPICTSLSTQQPRPPFETRSLEDGGTRTVLTTPPPFFPEGDSLGPNPANLLPTVYANAQTCRGNEIPNSLPSTPENPYNLHPDPRIRSINKISPTDDLDAILDEIEAMTAPREVCRMRRGERVCKTVYPAVSPIKIRLLARDALDIIEGNRLSPRLRNREYEGFPLLHYLGGLKTRTVDGTSKRVVINQIWYDSHIESDTSYLDPTAVLEDEWVIEYRVKVLNRGHEDFAPYAMLFDDPDELNLTDLGGPDLTRGGTRVPMIPNVAMDQTFFPMEEGLEYTFEIQMPPAKFWNLTYHWGWRIHPPRVQVVENILFPLPDGRPRNAEEIRVFGENPLASEATKLAAIDQIGDMAPAKRMWRMFRELQTARPRDGQAVYEKASLIREAFFDWLNRAKLPTGVEPDPDADITMLFINNTIYGQVKGHDGRAEVRIDHLWKKRGDSLRIKLLNGDYFPKGYVLVDFGGLRGWENIFQNTLPVGGAGPLFTFGRNYWWIHVAGEGPIPLMPAQRPAELLFVAVGKDKKKGGGLPASMFRGPGEDGGPFAMGAWGGKMKPVAPYTSSEGFFEHTRDLNFTYEPSRRLRLYQFDGMHHDVAVWSVH